MENNERKVKWNILMRKIVLSFYLENKLNSFKESQQFNLFSEVYTEEHFRQFGDYNFPLKKISGTFGNKIGNFQYLDTGKGRSAVGIDDRRIFNYYTLVGTDTLKVDIDNEKSKYRIRYSDINSLDDAPKLNISNKKFVKPNNELNEFTGRIGEEIVNQLLENGKFFEKTKNWVQTMKLEDFTWVNKIEESGLAYDFEINDKLYDVKTTTSDKNDNFYVSQGEWKLIQNGSLEILRVKIDKNFSNSLKGITLITNEELRQGNFEATQFIYKSINKNTKQ